MNPSLSLDTEDLLTDCLFPLHPHAGASNYPGTLRQVNDPQSHHRIRCKFALIGKGRHSNFRSGSRRFEYVMTSLKLQCRYDHSGKTHTNSPDCPRSLPNTLVVCYIRSVDLLPIPAHRCCCRGEWAGIRFVLSMTGVNVHALVLAFAIMHISSTNSSFCVESAESRRS